MKRRDFFERSGCGLAGALLASLGTVSCQRTPDKGFPPSSLARSTPEELAAAELSARKEAVRKLLVEKMGKTAPEADSIMADLEKKLVTVKEKCICETCPSALPEENETGFCHALIGRSKIIKDERACDCGQCPVYQEMGLKFGYYCTRGSELERESAEA